MMKMFAASVALLLSMSPAHAATVTFEGQDRLRLFDPSWGTLQRVTFDGSAAAILTFARSPLGSNFVIFACGGGVALFNVGASTRPVAYISDNSFCEIDKPDVMTTISIHMGGLVDTVSTDQQSDLTDFTGRGTIDIAPSFSLSAYAIAQELNSSNGLVVIDGSTRPIATEYFFDHRVQYEYTAVPEPTAWAMMISGFGIISYGARRRSRIAHQATRRLAIA